MLLDDNRDLTASYKTKRSAFLEGLFYIKKKKDLSEKGYTLTQTRELANNRGHWRKIVQSANESCVKRT